MKIKNTAASSGTTTLRDAECMPADYTVRFDEDDGTVAIVRAEVGEALIEKYPAIEPADDSDDGTDPDPDELQAARVVNDQDYDTENDSDRDTDNE